MSEDEIIIKCDCACSAVLVSKWTSETILTFYESYSPSVWVRIKYGLSILFGRHSRNLEMVLTKEETERLKEFL